MSDYSLAIHGGAGALTPGLYTDTEYAEVKEILESILDEGESILKSGGSAMDSVERCVQLMEDCPLLNAGVGSVFNSIEEHDLCASIMDGKSLEGGAVGCSKEIKNPILVSRAVLEKTPHVYLMGKGAHDFARENGFEMVQNSYFSTEKRKQQLIRAKERGTTILDHGNDDKHGTVGAVARDSQGNLAAATSTGGMTNKLPGRVSDSSMIGAGTYANNKTCAVSGTGTGDIFIKTVFCHRISNLMELAGMSLSEASLKALDELKELGGEGGVIGVDSRGEVVLHFNSKGMYRGLANGRERKIGIFKDWES